MKKWFAFIIVATALFIPGISNKSWMPSIYVENFLLIGVGLWLVLSGQRSIGQLFFDPYAKSMTLPYVLLLGYLTVMTVLFTTLTEPLVRIPFNLVISVSRYKPLVFLIILFPMLTRRKTIQQLAWFLIIAIFLEAGLMYCQKNNLFAVNSWLTPWYHGESEKYEGMTWRVIGSIGNPNNVGSVLSFFATLAYARFIYGKGLLSRAVCLAAVAVALFSTVWLAKTRQGTACILAGCFAVQMFSMVTSGRRGWGAIAMVVAMVGLIAFMGYIQVDPEVAERFGILTGEKSLSESGSMQARFQAWPQFFQEEGGGFVFGYGEQVHKTTWDSGYLNTLRKVGIPGLTLLLMLQIVPCIRASRRLKQIGADHPDSWLHVGLVCVIVPILLLQLINTTWTTPLVMTPLVTVYCLSLAAMKVEDAEAQDSCWLKPVPALDENPVGVLLSPSASGGLDMSRHADMRPGVDCAPHGS